MFKWNAAKIIRFFWIICFFLYFKQFLCLNFSFLQVTAGRDVICMRGRSHWVASIQLSFERNKQGPKNAECRI